MALFRLITRSAIYRAFPELDRFDDAKCSMLVQEARKRHGPPGVIVPPLAFLLICVAWIAVVALFAFVFGVNSTTAAILEIATLPLVVLVFPLCGFWVRDAWLRRSLRRVIVGADCPGCKYSMLGLPERAGHVRCPECGFRRPASELREALILAQESSLAVLRTSVPESD